eukprot:GHVS01048143.1.p1 GENE.GHVS01048143.1~~GHVS01048143.1.p1  ORF type:complete len:140 (+),score=12.21 GHVS01048143.1:182-601(+)
MSLPSLTLSRVLFYFYFVVLFVTATNGDYMTATQIVNTLDMCVLSKYQAISTVLRHPIFWFQNGVDCSQISHKCITYNNTYEGLSICVHKEKTIHEKHDYPWMRFVEDTYKYKLGQGSGNLDTLTKLFFNLNLDTGGEE